MEEDSKCCASVGRVFNDQISVRSQRSVVMLDSHTSVSSERDRSVIHARVYSFYEPVLCKASEWAGEKLVSNLTTLPGGG